MKYSQQTPKSVATCPLLFDASFQAQSSSESKKCGLEEISVGKMNTTALVTDEQKGITKKLMQADERKTILYPPSPRRNPG